jgi:predicted phage terminase large subunit-like protein
MDAMGVPPDPWQEAVLASDHRRIILLASRQSGKSEVSSAKAIQKALHEAPALILIVSPSERQSAEFMRDKITRQYRAMGEPVPVSGSRSVFKLELANGSRILALPGKTDTIVGYASVNLLIIDEAARVTDDLYKSVRPMLAVSGGQLIALSTPHGKQGWFYEAWKSEQDWHRERVTADQCARLKPEFLAEELIALGPAFYRQEYGCSFETMEGAEFPAEYFQESIWFDDDQFPAPTDLVASAMALDPSKGRDAKHGDFSAFVYAAKDNRGTYWIDADLKQGRPSPEIVEDGLALYARWRPLAFGVEINAFQELLGVEFLRVAATRKIHLPLYGINNTVNKKVRIRTVGPYLAQKLFRFRRKSRGCRILVNQLQEFPVADFDDGPDALEMVVRVIETLEGERRDADQADLPLVVSR